jgi:hypothetical protein
MLCKAIGFLKISQIEWRAIILFRFFLNNSCFSIFALYLCALFKIVLNTKLKNTMKKILTLGAIVCLLSACQKEEVKAPLTIPTNFDVANFDRNAATQLAVVIAINDITTEAKKGRVAGATVSNITLGRLFGTGVVSVKSQTTTYYANRLENEWFNEIAKASGTTYTPGNPQTKGQGGTFGGYLFDENGLEIEQMIEKGLFGSALYNHATSLVSGEMTTATADQLMAVMGMSPTFPSSNDATKHQRPDRAMAVYAARRDKNDGKGYYSQLKIELTKLQAALKAGAAYNTERDAAIVNILDVWEKVNAATIINYCHTVISTMSNTSTTEAQRASALHAYGECVGFAHGFRTVTRKKMTDAQLEEILGLLNAPHNGTPTSYLFVTEPATQLPKLQQVITRLQSIYGFTSAEVEEFKKNWVAEQSR